MNPTDRTLLEQMSINELEVEGRKQLFSISPEDVELLVECRGIVETKIDDLVATFYQRQTAITDVALLIGDADTLVRLKNAQKKYMLDLFSGVYDLEYVNHRLRIGLVHKRIGVEPKLYLSAVHSLKGILFELISHELSDQHRIDATLAALDRLLQFDITLVFDTYIRSMVAEIDASRTKAERYAISMEEKVRQRTRDLEEMSRTDPLTGLLNVRHLDELATTVLRSAQRRSEPVSIVYVDINEFKKINDTQGHPKGDEILRDVGRAIKKSARMEDVCVRYGGDEFCIVLPNCTQQQAQDIFMQRLQSEINGLMKDVSLSMGAAQTGPDEYVDARTLIRVADENMYKAKHEWNDHRAHSAH